MFTSLFAIGVILLSVYGANVHLDIEHSLMGEIAFVPWNTVTVLGVDIGKSVLDAGICSGFKCSVDQCVL